jgi:hypothetical protein
MANSSTYLVKTRNRCVVGVYGDTAGTITFGITASAFDNGFTDTNVDPRIDSTSASLSMVSYGISTNDKAVMGFDASPLRDRSIVLTLPEGTKQINFDRFSVPNQVVSPSDNGKFYVTIPASTTITAYLEFVPF